MKDMKITSVLLWVQDNTISEKFYKKLGFEVEGSDDQVSVVALGGLAIQLVTMRDEPPFEHDALSGDKGRGVYVYIRVSDVDTTHQELRSKGIIPATEPRDWEWGNREFIVKDPDGYKLCLWQPISAC